MIENPDAVFLDFHGTISNYTFWSSLPQKQYSRIQRSLFARNDQLVRKWMRGAVEIDVVKSYIQRSTGVELCDLDSALNHELERDIVDEDLQEIIRTLSSRVPVFLFSDNMDVISDWFSSCRVRKYFDHAWFSSDYGHLKNENGGTAYLKVCADHQLNIGRCIFFDDSQTSISAFERAGGVGQKVNGTAHTASLLRAVLQSVDDTSKTPAFA